MMLSDQLARDKGHGSAQDACRHPKALGWLGLTSTNISLRQYHRKTLVTWSWYAGHNVAFYVMPRRWTIF